MVVAYDYKNGNKKLSSHFMIGEFKCPASNVIKYSTDLIAMLENIFTKCSNVGKCIITSGYRTPEYSVKVGGTKSDAHTLGMAADCIFYDKKGKVIAPKYIACVASDMGFGGIGVMQNAVHLDVRHLGGYANKKWWGDETKNYSLSANGKTFYSYYGLTKANVEKLLGIATTTVSQPKPIVVTVSYFPKYNGKSASIVDILKSLKIDSSFNYRKKIANKNGISVYIGTASQNKKMVDLLKNGKLIKP